MKIPDCSRTSGTVTTDAHCHQELLKLDISVHWESPYNRTVSLPGNAKKQSTQILLPPNLWCNLGNIKLEPSRGSHPSARNSRTVTNTQEFPLILLSKSCLLKEPFFKKSRLYSPEALMKLYNKLTEHLQKQYYKHQAHIWICFVYCFSADKLPIKFRPVSHW